MEAESVAVGDFNGDGYKDIAIESTLKTANGAIIFGQPPSYSWPNPVNLNGIAAGYGVNITNLNTADYVGDIATGDVTGGGIDDAIFECGGC